MRRETFTESQPFDYELFDDLKATLMDVVEDLSIQVDHAGYKPVWQTCTIRTEEYSIDDSPMVAPDSAIRRYNTVVAEVMGVKE